MTERENKSSVAELERRVALLEEASRQTARIRQQWHASTKQLIQAKSELQASETKYRLLHDNAFDAIILADQHGIITETNPAAGRMFGWTPEEMAGLSIDRLVPEKFRERHRAGMAHYLATGEVRVLGKVIEMEALRQDGKIFPIEMLLSQLPIDGEIVFSATIRNITERKRAENALRHLNEELEEKVLQRTRELEAASRELQAQHGRLKAIIDNSIAGIGTMDAEGRYRQVNEALAQFLGYPQDELIGKNCLDITLPDDVADCRDNLKQLVDGDIRSYRMEKRFMRQDGETVWGDVSISTTYAPSGNTLEIVEIVTDITERKQTEAELHKFSRAVSQADEGVVITDSEGVIEYVNAAFTGITGYTAEESAGQPPSILRSDQQDEDFFRHLWQTISSGQHWEGRVMGRRKDGSEFPFHLTASPIFDNTRKITNYVGICQDLSEYEALEERFHQAQKMESLGTLAGGIAHEFNNMLAGITGNLHLATMKVKGMPDVERQLQNVQNISFRAADMIRQLLAFAHRDIVQMSTFDLVTFLDEACGLHRAAIPKQIDYRTEFCDETLMVRGDESQLHQILTNLLNNAQDAVREAKHPEITVHLERFEADEAFRKAHPNAKKNLFARLNIHDNGQGIPKKDIKDIFEPFFTTKPVGEGTGLGLSMVHGAVKMHGGYIEVESEEGKGCAFRIYIPLVQREPGTTTNEAPDTPMQGEGETVLLADDDPTVLETGSLVLGSLGYEVCTANNGRAAVEMFEKNKEDIRLVILDVVMPEMDGVEAAGHIRECSPDTGIILTTGYDKQQVVEQLKGMEHIAVLTKPYLVEQISQHIRRLIRA